MHLLVQLVVSLLRQRPRRKTLVEARCPVLPRVVASNQRSLAAFVPRAAVRELVLAQPL